MDSNLTVLLDDILKQFDPAATMSVDPIIENIILDKEVSISPRQFNVLLEDTSRFVHIATYLRNKKFRGDTLQLWYDIIGAFNSVGYEALTVRGVYYRVVSTAYRYPKTEATYRKVANAVLEMRRCSFLPYDFITDESRMYRFYSSYGSREEFLNSMARNYRRNLWEHSDFECEVWMEKNAMTSIIFPTTTEYDVKLYPLGGFSSETAIYAAAENFKATDKEVRILYLTDYDTAGIQMLGQVEKGLKRFGVDNVVIERIAVTPEQIETYSLPSRPDKKGSFDACELDAFKPDDIRNIVEESILRFIDEDEVARLKEIEKQEKESFKLLRFGS